MTNVAWDLDYTVLWTDVKPKPARIEASHNPYVHERLLGREAVVEVVITGRYMDALWNTVEMLKTLNIKPKRIAFNWENNYSQEHIATMKSERLNTLGVDIYVEDNASYREVMKQYWDGECISVDEYCERFWL